MEESTRILIWCLLISLFSLIGIYICYIDYRIQRAQIYTEEDLPVADEVKMATVVPGQLKLNYNIKIIF